MAVAQSTEKNAAPSEVDFRNMLRNNEIDARSRQRTSSPDVASASERPAFETSTLAKDAREAKKRRERKGRELERVREEQQRAMAYRMIGELVRAEGGHPQGSAQWENIQNKIVAQVGKLLNWGESKDRVAAYTESERQRNAKRMQQMVPEAGYMEQHWQDYLRGLSAKDRGWHERSVRGAIKDYDQYGLHTMKIEPQILASSLRSRDLFVMHFKYLLQMRGVRLRPSPKWYAKPKEVEVVDLDSDGDVSMQPVSTPERPRSASVEASSSTGAARSTAQKAGVGLSAAVVEPPAAIRTPGGRPPSVGPPSPRAPAPRTLPQHPALLKETTRFGPAEWAYGEHGTSWDPAPTQRMYQVLPVGESGCNGTTEEQDPV